MQRWIFLVLGNNYIIIKFSKPYLHLERKTQQIRLVGERALRNGKL